MLSAASNTFQTTSFDIQTYSIDSQDRKSRRASVSSTANMNGNVTANKLVDSTELSSRVFPKRRPFIIEAMRKLDDEKKESHSQTHLPSTPQFIEHCDKMSDNSNIDELISEFDMESCSLEAALEH